MLQSTMESDSDKSGHSIVPCSPLDTTAPSRAAGGAGGADSRSFRWNDPQTSVATSATDSEFTTPELSSQNKLF